MTSTMQTSSQRRALAALYFIVFIDSCSYGLLIPILQRLLNSDSTLLLPSVSEQTRNILFSIGIGLGALSRFVGAPFMGGLSDKLGRKKTLIYSLILTLTGFLCLIAGVLINNFSVVLLGRFIAGFGSSSQPIAQAAVIDISYGKQKAIHLSMIAFAMTLAMVAGPITGGYLSDANLVSWFNATTPFIAASLCIILCLLLISWYFKETGTQQNSGALSWQLLIQAFNTLLKQRYARLLIGCFFLYEFAWSLYFQYSASYMYHSYHYSPTQISNYIAYLSLIMSLGLVFVYRLMLRWLSIKGCLQLMFALDTLGLAFCTLLPGETNQWLGGGLVALATGIIYPSILATLSDQVDEKYQGSLMGVATSTLALAWLLSSTMMGVLGNIWLNLPLLLATSAMTSGFILVIYKKRFQTAKIINDPMS